MTALQVILENQAQNGQIRFEKEGMYTKLREMCFPYAK